MALPLKRFLNSEIGAAVIWVFGSLFLAALIFPWLYAGGKQLAAEAAANDLPAILESIGESAGRAKVGRFFNRALLISALGSLPFLIRRIRAIRRADPFVHKESEPQLTLTEKVSQLATAFLISGGILWLVGLVLHQLGAYTLNPNPPDLAKLASKSVLPTIGASLVEEWIFRGLLLGLWLRFARPLTACIGCSLLFAFLHFLHPPEAISDPYHPISGFVLLGKIFLHFTHLQFFVTDFATLTIVGLILAWARVRTGRLWFCIGLHAGWVFAFKLFGLLYDRADEHWLIPWGIGNSLRSGTFPMIGLLITAGICYFVLKKFSPSPSAGPHAPTSDIAPT